MKKLFLLFCGLFVMIDFLGCTQTAFAPFSDQSTNDKWQKIDNSFAKMELFYETDKEMESIQIYRLDPDNFDILFKNSSVNPKYVSEWADEMEKDGVKNYIIINAAYFHEDYSPSGYLKIDYNRVGERIFDQDLSGLLVVQDNKFLIRDLEENPLQVGEEIEFALQSYPFLIKDSVRAVKEDSGRQARRTSIGLDEKGLVYIIIVDDHRLSLYELMVELVKTDIKFVKVLNLDGGTSTGIAIKHGKYEEVLDSIVKVPSVVVFEKI